MSVQSSCTLSPVSVVPQKYRDAIQRELDALVSGERPELMTWVTAYPATLVRQPDLIWSHGESEVVERDDGTAYGVLPLWTADESPSDLSVEIEIDAHGKVTLSDLRVL
jgi:hypothetical protein